MLDIGSGYGGTARHLAGTHGCRVTGLSISEVENERHRKMNEAKGLQDLIDVVDGNFEDIPFPDNSFDIVWFQDAMLHSGAGIR
ncbi:MAG: methyltransferase domain-containing protein [SAR324 cluster bacterium]|nr:methyltransferase domain-containing protein [SAR324 cluster bacterium]